MQRLRPPHESGSRVENETGTAPGRWEQEWESAAEIDRREAAQSARGGTRAFINLLGLVALAAGGLAGVYPLTPGFSMHDTAAAVLAAAIVAVVSLAVVLLANRAGRGLAHSGADDLLIFTAALASVGAAAIHFAVAKMHFDEYALFGVFFVLSGIAQLVWPIWLLLRRWSPLLVLGAIGNALIVALWAVDRIWGLPIGPEHWKPDPVGFGDSVASGLEVLLVACAVALLRRGRRTAPRRTTELGLSLSVAALTTLALLSVLGVGSSLLTPSQ
jgi:hypothetical protein